MRPISILTAALCLAAPVVASAAPPPVQKHVCSNGLEIYVAENHATPIFTVEIAAHNGSMTEPPEFNGLSHLYEHMFFKANAALPSQEAYLARARELGLEWNGTTNTERVNYFFTTTTDHFHDAMIFMRDAIVTPKFDAGELERERKVVTGEIDRNESNPYYFFNHEVENHVFYKFPSRKDPLGNRKTVLSATVEKMKTIQSRYYVPNNSALFVTGDVKAAEVFALADSIYGIWAKGEDPFKKFPLVKHPPLKGTEVVVVEQPVKTFTGSFVYHGPSTDGDQLKDSYPADLSGIALSQPSSKFQTALVDSGLCTNAGLGWYTQKNLGPITVSFEAAPDKVDACIKAVIAELPKIKTDGYFTDEELKSAAFAVEVGQIHERESSSGLAHNLSFWWASASVDYYANYLDNLKKTTRADIARYMDTYITGKPFVFGVLVSPEMAKAGLDKAHFEQLISIGKGALPTKAGVKKDGAKKDAPAATPKKDTTKKAGAK
jgi:zinc protease